jgi:NAD(P)-dependent dehydrogenase (short-subunit alcohol dehydrogenase family)
MQDLRNKKVAVVGGNGLIGSAIVNYLISCEALPVVIDLDNKNVRQTEFIAFDITRLSELKKLGEALVEKNNIDAIVNVSFARSKGWKSHADEINWDEWQANIDAQLNSVCLLSLSVANSWVVRSNAGVILNISSIFGVIAPPMHLYDHVTTFPALPYPAIKGGLIAFTTFLAGKFGKNGIRANCISPGAVEGSQMQKADKFIEGMRKNMLGRLAQPEEIAKPAAFLLSNDSSFITGQNIIVDGGWTNM